MGFVAKVGLTQGRLIVIVLDDENVACIHRFCWWKPSHILGLIHFKIHQKWGTPDSREWWRSVEPEGSSEACQNRDHE